VAIPPNQQILAGVIMADTPRKDRQVEMFGVSGIAITETPNIYSILGDIEVHLGVEQGAECGNGAA
jgi:hypothetical protein